jgi:hypothetical protein
VPEDYVHRIAAPDAQAFPAPPSPFATSRKKQFGRFEKLTAKKTPSLKTTPTH